MTELVGVSGYARSGKDSAVAGLLTLGYERRSFADKLREAALALDPIVGTRSEWDSNGCSCCDPVEWVIEERLSDVVERVGWELAKDRYDEVRRILQRLGTDAARNVLGQNIWVQAAMAGVREGDMVAFSDVRFPNEADAIRERGGLVLRVNRPGVGPAVNEDGETHVSETAMDDYLFDAVIENVSGLGVLQQQIRDAVTNRVAKLIKL